MWKNTFNSYFTLSIILHFMLGPISNIYIISFCCRENIAKHFASLILYPGEGRWNQDHCRVFLNICIWKRETNCNFFAKKKNINRSENRDIRTESFEVAVTVYILPKFYFIYDSNMKINSCWMKPSLFQNVIEVF